MRQADGLGAYRTPAPPAAFDPNTASDAVLRRHGLPRRPDPEREPELARLWQRAFGRPLTYVKADLAIDPWLSDRNPLQDKDPEFGPNNWTGAVVRPGQPFSWVSAQWVIPSVPKKGVWADDVLISFWVGIDGFTMGDDQVLQAGVSVEMHTSWFGWPPWPHVVVDWRAWTEWWVQGVPSSYAVDVPNFPVKPGDTVAFIVCAPPDAWVNVLNLSTGQHTSVGVPTPTGVSGEPVMLQGDSVEWIVEVVKPAAPNLPQFAPVTFNECVAGGPHSFVDLLNAFPVNIVGPSGDLTEVQIDQPRTAIVRRESGASRTGRRSLRPPSFARSRELDRPDSAVSTGEND